MPFAYWSATVSINQKHTQNKPVIAWQYPWAQTKGPRMKWKNTSDLSWTQPHWTHLGWTGTLTACQASSPILGPDLTDALHKKMVGVYFSFSVQPWWRHWGWEVSSMFTLNFLTIAQSTQNGHVTEESQVRISLGATAPRVYLIWNTETVKIRHTSPLEHTLPLAWSVL